MHPATRELLNFLSRQRAEVFDITGRVDDRRYLGREFPEDLPLLLSLQQYPAYKHMVGENWLHWHDYFECFVALSGEGDFCAGNDRFLFQPGDVVVVDPLKIHGVMRMEATHSALVILFPRRLIAPTESAVDVAFLSAWENRVSEALPVLRAGHKAAPAVHEALLALMQVWFGKGADTERGMELKLRFMEVLMRLRAGFAAKEDAKGSTHSDRALRESRLRRALDFVSLHGHEAISQPQVAKAAGMSTSRFRAFFKETTGWGFARYLREQRVERAAKLLRESSESIAAIAHRTGFADQSHLLRCFRDKFAVSPKDYRRKHGGT
jgi:AraC-like DNA-binding protein